MGKRVLIIDDETAILLGFKKILNCDGREVDTAETLAEARKLINERDYDFIITDLKLSGSVGNEGLEILRIAKNKRPSTEIILITGYGNEEVQEKALALGATYYYEKPVSGQVLKQTLARLGV